MAELKPAKRIADFENYGFGMFVHWGLYSQLGRGEWVMNLENIPLEEYMKLADTFKPDKFDARRLVRTAKAAGMKYITLTTRHHDGFSLYDTKGLSDYDAPHVCGRDLIREYVDACNEEGIVPLFYHTTLDWYRPEFNSDFSRYLQYLRDSVEILCTNYGKIGGLWFDGNWSKKDADWEEDALYGVIRKHQPDAIIVNNTGLDARGNAGNIELDSVTFEQGRPTPMDRSGMVKYLAAEMCQTTNDHWGYGACDFNYKSLPELIETLCACRKVGANLLLNVGPDGEGALPLIQEAMLLEMGKWIKKAGGCIYEGKPSSLSGEGKDFALTKGDKEYLFVHGLTIIGDHNVTVSGITGNGPHKFTGISGRKVKSVHWTDNGEELQFTSGDGALTIEATGYPYGTNLVVRVAEVIFED